MVNVLPLGDGDVEMRWCVLIRGGMKKMKKKSKKRVEKGYELRAQRSQPLFLKK